MSDYEMNSMDMELEDVANRNHSNERPAAHNVQDQRQPGFWNQLDEELHYKKYKRNRAIMGAVKILICIVAVAALVCALYIPEALPYVVNIGVAAFIVAGAITIDRMIARFRV
jgi:Flp pilus assembly protein TadB